MENRISVLTGIAAAILVSVVEAKSYVAETPKFINIPDPHRQAEAWSMCVAAYRLMAGIYEEAAPARAKKLSDMANGAKVAVTMSMIYSEFDEDMTPEKFSNLWRFSVATAGNIPDSMQTTLLAALESDESEDKTEFLTDLAETVVVCFDNADGQQMYIDMYRDMVKSGLLQLPDA